MCLCVLVLGFEPMKGDWVQAEYFVSTTKWTSQARTVAPLRYQRMDQVSPNTHTANVPIPHFLFLKNSIYVFIIQFVCL